MDGGERREISRGKVGEEEGEREVEKEPGGM